MKLNYEIEIEDEISGIEEIHNYLDTVFLREKKCRVCGCDWFRACPGGCYWVEDDLCSRCEGEKNDE